MEQLVSGVGLVFSRKDSRRIIIIITLVFLLLLVSIQNGTASFTALTFTILPVWQRITLSLSTLFDIKDTFTLSALILSILGSLLGGINIAMAYVYIKTRGVLLVKSGLYSGLGLVFALLGVGCAACGTALFGVLLSFLGLSSMLHMLPYQGEEIGYIGIIFLCMATYSLSRKVSAPAAC